MKTEYPEFKPGDKSGRMINGCRFFSFVVDFGGKTPLVAAECLDVSPIPNKTLIAIAGNPTDFIVTVPPREMWKIRRQWLKMVLEQRQAFLGSGNAV